MSKLIIILIVKLDPEKLEDEGEKKLISKSILIVPKAEKAIKK